MRDRRKYRLPTLMLEFDEQPTEKRAGFKKRDRRRIRTAIDTIFGPAYDTARSGLPQGSAVAIHGGVHVDAIAKRF
jgi:hypothetical protein